MRPFVPLLLLFGSLAGSPALADGVEAKPASPRPLSEIVTVSGCDSCETWWPRLFPTGAAGVLVGWHLLHDDLHFTLDRYDTGGVLQESLATVGGREFLQIGGALQRGGEVLFTATEPNRIYLEVLRPGEPPPDLLSPINAPGPGETDSGGESWARGDRALVVWTRVENEGSRSSVLAQFHAGSGDRLAGPIVVGESFGASVPRGCLLPNGGAVVAWALYDQPRLPAGITPVGVAVRRLAPDGSPVGSATIVAPPDLQPLSVDAGHAVACAADGSYFVAWTTIRSPAKQGWDVVLQRFDKLGRRRGLPRVVNSNLPGDQLQPILLPRANGSLLVVWESPGSDGTRVLAGRRVNSAGAPLGKDFILHTASAGVDRGLFASLADLTGSRFALGWWEGRRALLRTFAD